MADFFISYTAADKDWAEWVAWVLDESGATTTLQAWDFGAGSNFALEMHRAAGEAQRTIAVLSPDYLKSKFGAAEWAAAFIDDPTGQNRKLIPVRVRECAPGGILGSIVYEDFVGVDEAEARQRIKRLLDDLAGKRGKPERAPRFPRQPKPFPGGAQVVSTAAQPVAAAPRLGAISPEPAFGVAGIYRRTVKPFLGEYLVSETGEVPFGGRDAELKRLDDWLFDETAAPRMVVTSPAGRGKSAMLVQWLKLLQARGHVGEAGWWLAFMPISIRAGTNKPGVFLGGLAHRLAEITGKPVPPDAAQNPDALKYAVQDQIEAIAADQHLLLVLDGLDKALQGSFDAAIIPAKLPKNIRVLLSARWEVGDSDSSGWLRRLGWDRAVRIETLELARLPSDAIADVLIKLGAPTDLLGQERPIVARLSALTEGEPLLVRFYAEDLWQLGHQRARITLADLDSLRPGFGNYFERWLSHQERLWTDEGARADRTEVDRVLSILAFALGPLESRDLLALMKEIHGTENLLSEKELVQPLRRFIIRDGSTGTGYVLTHPKIGYYLQNDRFRGSAATLRRGFVTWGQKHLRALNCGDLDPQDASPYVLQFLQGHFHGARLPASAWMELVEDGWRRAWEQFEGVPRGFAADVHAAWDSVRRDAGNLRTLGWRWRCALVLSSIRSIGINTPDALLCTAVACGRLSLRQAVHFVEVGRIGPEAIALLLKLSKLENTSAAQSSDLISMAFETAAAIDREADCVLAFAAVKPHLSPDENDLLHNINRIGNAVPRTRTIEALAPYLPPNLIADVFAASQAIGDEGDRARILAALAPHLASDLIPEALAAANAIKDENNRTHALTALAPRHLSPEQVTKRLVEMLTAVGSIGEEWMKVVAFGTVVSTLPPHERAKVLSPDDWTKALTEGLAIAKVIHNPSHRAQALAALAPHLAQGQITEALAASKTIRDEWERVYAIEALAPHLPSEQRAAALAEAFAAAKAIEDGSSRAFVLASLASCLASEQRASAVAEALTAAKAIGKEISRAFLLQVIAPHLSQVHMAEALAIARAIGSESNRVLALGSLAVHLSGNQKDIVLAEALGTAKGISDKVERARALVALAPYLPPEEQASTLAEALSTARAIDDGSSQARELISIARHLQFEQKAEVLKEALSIARAIGDDEQHAMALAALAPQFPSDDLIDAFSAAKAISSTSHRVFALIALAPHLPPEQKVIALAEALADTKAMDSEIDRACKLAALKPQLSRDQIAEAFAAAEAIGSESNRALAFEMLASHLSQGEIAQALAKAKAFGGAEARAIALRGLSAYGGTSQLEALSALIDTAAELHRAQALSYVKFSIAVSAALGGVEALKDISCAISDAARWYP